MLNLSYFKHRYKLLRREYHAMADHWLIHKGFWLVHLVGYLVRYVYHAELLQIHFFEHQIKQKNRHIDFLQAEKVEYEKDAYRRPSEGKFPEFLIKVIQILFFPLVVISFIFRKLWRFWVLRRHPLELIESTNQQGHPSKEYEGPVVNLKISPASDNKFPSGLNLLILDLKHDQKPLAAYLMINPGTGFNDEYAIPLVINKAGRIDQLIELPPVCKGLRLWFEGDPQQMKIRDVELQETNIIRAAWRRYRQSDEGFFISLYNIFVRFLPVIYTPPGYKLAYSEWISKFDHLGVHDRQGINHHIKAFESRPVICLYLHVDESDPIGLKLTLKSLTRQLYPDWHLLIHYNGELGSKIIAEIATLDRYHKQISYINNGDLNQKLSDVLNETQLFLALMQGAILSDHALYLFASAIQDDHSYGLVYGDHDYMDSSGCRHSHCFKPDWNEEFFLASGYIGELAAYKTDLLTADLDAICKYLDSNKLLNLQMHVLKKLEAHQIWHAPYIVYHRYQHNSHDPLPERGFRELVNDYIQQTKKPYTIGANPYDQDKLRLKTADSVDKPLVSIIIPTRNAFLLLSQCIRGLLEKTSYPNFEIILVDNNSDCPETIEFIRSIESDSRITVTSHREDFNFSKINNRAVDIARGNFVLLMNNDIAIIKPDWLDEMMSWMQSDDVAVVGSKLLYANDTIQHAGVTISIGGVAGHSFRYFPRYSSGYMDRLYHVQQLSCVTGACLLTRKSVYREVGGLNEENLKIAFNDVDYCLKVREKGYKIIWTPFAELYHLETATRGSDLAPKNLARWISEYEYMKETWGKVLGEDPFYNPNLTIIEEDFSLANKSRVFKPWETYMLN